MDPEFKMLREQVIPNVSRVPGFVSGYWLAPVDGIGRGGVIWESEAAARTASERMGVKPGGSLAPGTRFESSSSRSGGA